MSFFVFFLIVLPVSIAFLYLLSGALFILATGRSPNELVLGAFTGVTAIILAILVLSLYNGL